MWLAFNDVLRAEAPGWGFPQVIRIEGDVDQRFLAKRWCPGAKTRVIARDLCGNRWRTCPVIHRSRDRRLAIP